MDVIRIQLQMRIGGYSLKRNRHVLISMSVTLGIVGITALIAYILCGTGFVSNDCYEQYLPFMYAYYDVIAEGKSIFYSMSGSMGFDFWAVFSYYLVTPLNFIIFLFGKTRMIYALNLLIILKIVFCSGTFSVFLKNRFPKAKCNRIVLFSVIFSLCGFMLGYAWNIMWLDGLVLFPLVMFGMDLLMRDENPKWYWYTVFLAAMIVVSYFIGYMTCIFIFLYFFTYKFNEAKDFFKKLLKIGLSSILALGISAIILIPAFGGLSTTSISEEAIPAMEFYGSFVNSFKTAMFAVPQNSINFARENANLFMTAFGLLMAFIYITSGSIKLSSKIKNIVLLAVLMLSFNFRPLNFIWHGMHEQTGIPNRFAFMVTFLLITMAFEIAVTDKKAVKKGSVFAGFGLMLLYVAVMAFFDNSLIINAALTAGLGLVYTLLLCFAKGKLKFNMICIFAIIECAVMLIISMMMSNSQILLNYADYVDEFETINNEKEDGFYREKIDEVFNENEIDFETVSGPDFEADSIDSIKEMLSIMKNVGHQSIVNEDTVYGLNSMSLFNTFNNYAQTDFYCHIGATGGINNVMYYGENPFMDMLLGVRYFYTRYYDANASTYDFVKAVNDVNVYENRYILSLGYVIPEELLTDTELLRDNPFATMNNISKYVMGENVYEYSSFSLTEDNDDTTGYKTYTYTADKTGELQFMLNLSKLNYYTVRVDDEIVYKSTRDSMVMDLGVIKEGQTVTIECCLEEIGDTGSTIYAAILKPEVLEAVYKELSDEQIELSEYSEDYFKGTIDIKEAGRVMITVPYSAGWTIAVDGKEAKTELLCDLFYVLELSEGEHEIEMKYVTPGFYMGALISVGSILITVIAVIITVNIKKKKLEI